MQKTIVSTLHLSKSLAKDNKSTYALCLGWQAPMVVHMCRAPSSLEMNLWGK